MLSPQQFNLLGFNLTGDLGAYTCYTSKRHRLVLFIKAPPKTPPTQRQLYHRDRWRITAITWKLKTQAERDLWELATKRANLFLTGYNLYVWWKTTQDEPTMQTIIRQSKVPIPI